MQSFSKIDLKKTILGVFSRDNPNDYKPLKMSNRTLDKLFEEEVLMVLDRRDEDKKNKNRHSSAYS